MTYQKIKPEFIDISLASTGQTLVSNGTSMTFSDIKPTFTAVASGTLNNGDKVIINSNGTVSAVTFTATTSVSSGAESVASLTQSSFISCGYDNVNSKICIVFRDTGNSTTRYVIGTVSGSTITFGTPGTLYAGVVGSRIHVEFEPVNQKLLIFYGDPGNNNYATVQIGTVSGTTVTFATPVVVSTAPIGTSVARYSSVSNTTVFFYSAYNQLHVKSGSLLGNTYTFGAQTSFTTSNMFDLDAAYDNTTGRWIVVGQYAGVGRSVIVSVTGTTINYISAASTFANSGIDTNGYRSTQVEYDSTQQKVIVCYKTSGSQIKSNIGTVAGNTISYNTVVTQNAATIDYFGMAYESTTGKPVLAIIKSSALYISVGTVASNTITFSSDANTGTIFSSQEGIYAVDAPTPGKIICAYPNGSLYISAKVVNTFTGATNLTNTNYIGISDAAYTNGQTATIQIAGAVDDAQSGLTPGTQYYIQKNGTLGTTADTPSVIAGTAVATTKIIVKG